MKWPPMVMRLSVRNSGRGFSLWLPLFILGPLFLVLLLPLLPLLLLAGLVLWPTGWGRSLWLMVSLVLAVLCALRGLRVDIRQGRERVLVFFE